MKFRATTSFVCLALCGSLALFPAARAGDDEAADAEVAERIARLQEAAAALEAPAGSAGAEGTSEELTEQLRRLRREIEELLALLPAAPPAAGPEAGAELKEAVVETMGDTPAVNDEAGDSAGGSESAIEAPAAAQAAASEPSPAPPVEEACAEFAVFDSNEDGVVSGLDRYWRYFRLWKDDGDGAIEESELSGLYDAGIGELTVALGTYRTVDGDAGDVLGDGGLRVSLLGKRGGMAALVLDADRLARGGEIELRDGSGAALSGLQALTSEMAVVSLEGVPAPLFCP